MVYRLWISTQSYDKSVRLDYSFAKMSGLRGSRGLELIN